jgi:Transposase DDE domain group 1
MKLSRSDANCKAHARPTLRFESHQLTAFGGIVVLQELFRSLNLLDQLKDVFYRRQTGKIYRPQKLFLQLILHLLLGFRSLRDVTCYRDDPLVQRVLGMHCIVNPATMSRMLQDVSDGEVLALRRLMSGQVLDRLSLIALPRITLDFDGSVCSTTRRAEGTAVGFNRKKKGARSYYPLFCTIAQTGQVLDLLHRPGNVHDSKGAREFILHCVRLVRERCPYSILEIRMDSAFFSDEVVDALADEGVEFSISVPFERFPKLKQLVESRRRWKRSGPGCSSFELSWKPDCWTRCYRFLVIRQEVVKQRKGELQLDLFEPRDWDYEFKVIVTNKNVGVRSVTRFHEGRGSQEGIFAELKTDVAMGHIPVRSRNGNQAYLLAGLLAHNMIRELQMRQSPPTRATNVTRAARWVFEQVGNLRRHVFQRAGRLTRPGGRLTLTINASTTDQTRILALRAAANSPADAAA